MQNTLAPWTGEPFTSPTEPAAPLAPPTPAPIGRMRHWSFSVGRQGLSISSSVEDYRPRIVAPVMERRSGMAMLVAAVAGGLALLLVGASAGRAWSPAPDRAEAAMIIPTATPVPAPVAFARAAPDRRPALGRGTPVIATKEPSTNSAAIGRNEAIARALGTGDFQEWAASDGTTGFAVAGPAEITAQGTCRALAVLTRKIDGSDSVASSRECRPAGEALPR